MSTELSAARLGAARWAEQNICEDEYVLAHWNADDDSSHWVECMDRLRRCVMLEPNDHDLRDCGLERPAVFVVVFAPGTAEIIASVVVHPHDFGANLHYVPEPAEDDAPGLWARPNRT